MRVKGISCVCCGASSPSEAHHVRTGVGLAQKNPHFLTAALCAACHRGPLGIHGDKSLLRIQKVTEMDLLARTLEALYGR